jgi:hypothetical protein
MGKRAKEHRKKVQIRNQKIATERKKFQKLYSEMLTKKLEELQEKYSSTTENEEVLNTSENIVITGETE